MKLLIIVGVICFTFKVTDFVIMIFKFIVVNFNLSFDKITITEILIRNYSAKRNFFVKDLLGIKFVIAKMEFVISIDCLIMVIDFKFIDL